MKIITVFPSFANKGGAEDIAISIAQGLNTDGRPIILQHDTAVCEQYGNLNRSEEHTSELQSPM